MFMLTHFWDVTHALSLLDLHVLHTVKQYGGMLDIIHKSEATLTSNNTHSFDYVDNNF